MTLSSQKDLLLCNLISLAVLIISWVHLLNVSTLTLLQYFVILLVPGYAIITTILPTNEIISRTIRLGIIFTRGLSVLFLILMMESLNLNFTTITLTNLLLIAAIVLSLLTMDHRSKLGGEPQERGSQLTLEEPIQRFKNIAPC